MKYKGTKQAVFQAFLFNAIALVIFFVIGIYYLYPEYTETKEKKEEFGLISKTYKNLQEKGLSFKDFNRMHKKESSTKKTENTVLLTNILTDFREDDYIAHFTNTGTVYETFLNNKAVDAKEKRKQQASTNISSKINEVLPQYTADSSLSEDSLTDFKFINHIESLLDRFQLSTKDKIGIGNLSEVGGVKNEKGEKKVKQNPLDAIIYEGKLQLGLIGEKKNIVNFLHYVENVGKISVEDKQVSIYKMDNSRVFIDKEGNRVKNNFLDLSSYFKKGVNPFDGLVMEVGSLDFSEYLDSSDLPTPEGYNIIQLVKEGQAKEKFQIDITLKYYVKGLPTFKIEKFIIGVQSRHAELLKISNIGYAYVSKNRASLEQSNSIIAIGNLGKINKYLLGLQKDIDEMKKSLAKKEEMGDIYKTAQELDTIFEVITKKLSEDFEAVSEELYKEHKNILNKKDQQDG